MDRERSSANPRRKKTQESLSSVGFPVAGIGASAGGLEAFEHLFQHLPPDSGIAFVLVPHLDPERTSILATILQRNTKMPVMEAEDGMRLAPNHVYVIAPNTEMAIVQCILRLSAPKEPRGHRMPIDHFFRSLAADQAEKAIGIIVSGTGTDGTEGMRAIAGAGGVTFVQDPATAKYSGMPESVIDSGFATYVLPAEKIAEALAAPRPVPATKPEAAPEKNRGLAKIFAILRAGTGNDFALYKKSTMLRRIERRMSRHSLDDMEVYARFLQANPPEVQLLLKELLINVTRFFRDPEAFTLLKNEAIARQIDAKRQDYVFRVWVPGCATGEEAYSIAILLQELMDESKRHLKIQIYSTDLDEEAIVKARAGFYSPNIAADISPERLNRFFIKQDHGYQVKKNIREMLVFATQNVIKDPPFTRLDLLSCRNLMIYLEPELQSQLIPSFHYALKPDGILFLSSSESTANRTDLFTPLSRKWKIYRAIPSSNPTRSIITSGPIWTGHRESSQPADSTKKTRDVNIAELAKRLLLQFFAPASVLTDLRGNVQYVYGETGKYLRPAPGHVSLNIVDMAREGLQTELRSALQKASSQGLTTLDRELLVKTNGDFQSIVFSVRPVTGQNSGDGLLFVSFHEAPTRPTEKLPTRRSPSSAKNLRIQELERDLGHTRENLQAIIEEQQASNEELKSANEEMQSTNEELQSANEELETSKEELQSVNEELITVNAELQAKIEQLADMQNDMKNLLDNMNVGTIFLDQHLVIRRFTREAARVYRLVGSDVGRSIVDIKSDLEDEDLLRNARTVLETLVPYEHEVHTVSGQWYLARVQPYRTLDNAIEGIVLTLTDIGKRVEAETAVQEARELAECIVDMVREPLVVLDREFKIVSASRSFYEMFGFTPAATIGWSIYDVGSRRWDIAELRNLLEKILPLNQSFERYKVELNKSDITQPMFLNGRRIIAKKGKTQLICLQWSF